MSTVTWTTRQEETNNDAGKSESCCTDPREWIFESTTDETSIDLVLRFWLDAVFASESEFGERFLSWRQPPCLFRGRRHNNECEQAKLRLIASVLSAGRASKMADRTKAVTEPSI